MKSKCVNVVFIVAFLVMGLLVTGSALAQPTEQDARDNAATSLHTTIYGMEIFYTTDGSHPDFSGPGYESMTGVPYNTLPCAGCHAASNPPPYTDPDGCDKCHTDLVAFQDAIPDSTCAGCHGRQNKEAAKGFTDVHDTAYPNCTDCHTWNEMHGTGVEYDSMLAPGAMEVTCEGCHTGVAPEGPPVDVASHDPHAGKLHCSACHVKSVITCYNCHFDSQVDGVGKFANTALGANNKDTGFVMLMNSGGQVRTATFQSIVYDGGNEFAAFAPYHGHSVGTGADARTCDDCHANDAMEQLNTTGKIVLTSWNGSAIVQETTGAIPVVDGAIEMAFVDLISTGPNVWDYMSTGFGTTQYGYGTPLTESQLTALSVLPPPPVRQELGFYDGAFSDMEEADCRICHDLGVPDRHHMLYGQPIPPGSLIPNPDANGDGIPDTHYGCLNCHEEDDSSGVIVFDVERDCLVCHTGDSPHHGTPDALARHCTVCHGDLVDDFDDGHTIPGYAPSMVTPAPSTDGEAGGCNYCHDADSTATPPIVDNETAHHTTGLFNGGFCGWCHDFPPPAEDDIRTCEDCHGFESLHNIQADSPAPGNIGTIVVGGEEPWYGHVGADDPQGASDCWGCHGFSMASAPASGPIIPSISDSDVSTMITGTDTVLTITGAAFIDDENTSYVVLADADGYETELYPDSITQDQLTVTIPGATPAGNYTLQAVKDADTASNPVSISIMPLVEITDMDCSKCLSTMTITGTGFAVKPDGTDEDISVTEGGRLLNVISWSDTEIEVSGARCRGEVVVNSVFGSVSE